MGRQGAGRKRSRKMAASWNVDAHVYDDHVFREVFKPVLFARYGGIDEEVDPIAPLAPAVHDGVVPRAGVAGAFRGRTDKLPRTNESTRP